MAWSLNTAGTDLDTVTLQNNAWKKAVINAAITADSVLHFEFKSDTSGKIHGIGFDADNDLSPEWTFQLHGSQVWGNQDFDGQYATGSGWQHYSINVGSYLQGDFANLIFVMDDDAGLGADSAFRNIMIQDELVF